MGINVIVEYAVPVVVGICLCIGFIIKHAIPTEKVDKYIPCIVSVVGVAMNIWINFGVNPEIILGGLISGLASTGLHQAFKQFLDKDGD